MMEMRGKVWYSGVKEALRGRKICGCGGGYCRRFCKSILQL